MLFALVKQRNLSQEEFYEMEKRPVRQRLPRSWSRRGAQGGAPDQLLHVHTNEAAPSATGPF